MYIYKGKTPLTVTLPREGVKTFFNGDRISKLSHPRLKACLKTGDVVNEPNLPAKPEKKVEPPPIPPEAKSGKKTKKKSKKKDKVNGGDKDDRGSGAF